jgi:hypothetical protein
MGKKKSRTSQTSTGTVGRSKRKEYRGTAEHSINQLAAFYRGRNVVLTVENPNKNETNKRFIRVNARDVWTGGGKEKKR